MTSIRIRSVPRAALPPGTRAPARRGRRSAAALAGGLLLALSMTGCACRPGYVGPYGGVHPARCWVW